MQTPNSLDYRTGKISTEEHLLGSAVIHIPRMAGALVRLTDAVDVCAGAGLHHCCGAHRYILHGWVRAGGPGSARSAARPEIARRGEA